MYFTQTDLAAKLFVSSIIKCTWCEEMFALEIVRLASAFIAVRSSSTVLTGQAVHDIEVLGTERSTAITVFGKITDVGRVSASPTGNSDLKQKQQFYFLYSVQS